MAIPDVTEAIRLAKILVFVIPHQFISGVCEQIKSHVTEGTIGISLIKVTSSSFFSLLPPLISSLTHFLPTSSSPLRALTLTAIAFRVSMQVQGD